jgi:hypothetical protein
MRLASEEPVEKGRRFDLELVIPLDAEQAERIAIQARSIWCTEERDDEFYYAGFRFEGLSRQDYNAIKRLLRDDFLLAR